MKKALIAAVLAVAVLLELSGCQRSGTASRPEKTVNGFAYFTPYNYLEGKIPAKIDGSFYYRPVTPLLEVYPDAQIIRSEPQVPAREGYDRGEVLLTDDREIVYYTKFVAETGSPPLPEQNQVNSLLCLRDPASGDMKVLLPEKRNTHRAAVEISGQKLIYTEDPSSTSRLSLLRMVDLDSGEDQLIAPAESENGASVSGVTLLDGHTLFFAISYGKETPLFSYDPITPEVPPVKLADYSGGILAGESFIPNRLPPTARTKPSPSKRPEKRNPSRPIRSNIPSGSVRATPW